ncbi:unnamed protein product, partial [Mesorhabditis spiculigera]
MTEGKPRPIERQGGRYDLAEYGLALRIDLTKLESWKSKQPERPQEKTLFTLTDNHPDGKTVALKIVEKLGSVDYLSEDDIEPKYNPDADEIRSLCLALEPHLIKEKAVARPQGRTIVVGDIHGNLNDLWRIIHAWLSDVVGQGPKQNIIFLGDIVDRGDRQLECLILIMAYKTLFPEQVFILRGNHEEGEINMKDFQQVMTDRGYRPSKTHDAVKARRQTNPPRKVDAIDAIMAYFERLPVVGLIDGRILCMHGMISMELTKKMLQAGWDVLEGTYANMNRHLRWNDPSEKVEFCEVNNVRRYGMVLAPKTVAAAMGRLGVEFVLRGHQKMTNGVRRFANLPVATVFSASFYQKENFGAVLFVDPDRNAIVPIYIVSHDDETTMDYHG